MLLPLGLVRSWAFKVERIMGGVGFGSTVGNVIFCNGLPLELLFCITRCYFSNRTFKELRATTAQLYFYSIWKVNSYFCLPVFQISFPTDILSFLYIIKILFLHHSLFIFQYTFRKISFIHSQLLNFSNFQQLYFYKYLDYHIFRQSFFFFFNNFGGHAFQTVIGPFNQMIQISWGTCKLQQRYGKSYEHLNLTFMLAVFIFVIL